MRMVRRQKLLVWILMAAGSVAAGPVPAAAQASTRLLVSSGDGVPGHAGFVFGPFSGLAMNSRKQIVFLSTIRSERTERRAIIRSAGVSFSVAVFQGLVSPLPRMLFDSFTAPSINTSGDLAFSAGLTGVDEGTPPSSGVFRTSGESVQLVAAAGQNVPGQAGAFQEFSAPVIGSTGAVLFSARATGAQSSGGLFLWTPRGISPVALPADFRLSAADLLVPVFETQDESVWARRDDSSDAALDEFFRAVAIKNFQQLSPPPEPSDSVTVLGPAPGEKPVQLLLVLFEGEKAETAEVQGDPSLPVMGKLAAGPPLELPLAGVEGQVPGAVSGSVVFAAAPLAHPDGLELYCFCGGEAVRLTSPQDFPPAAAGSVARSVASLAGDGQHTVAFVAAGAPGENSNSIYVTSLP